MIVVIVTGSVGTGKSTVAQAFSHAHTPPWPLWDADEVVSGLYKPGGDAVELVAERFPLAHTKEGGIDVKVLRKLLEGKSDQWKRLEKAVHPLVRLSMHRFLEQNLKKDPQICVLDIPLLYEGKLEHLADCVVVTVAQDDLVLLRLANRGMRSVDKKRLAEIRARQISSSEKEERADFVIHNNSTQEHITQEVGKIIKNLGIAL